MTGYDLARLFDISVANFWHALPAQIYAELPKLEGAGFVTSRVVIQESRPNKRLYTLSEAGRAELSAWIGKDARPASVKDELLVRAYASTRADEPRLAAAIERRAEKHREKIARYRGIETALLRGRDDAEYARTATRLGPYLTLKRGIGYESEGLAWCEWALEALTARAGSPGP